MSDTLTIPIQLPSAPPPSKFDREYRAFRAMLPDLLRTHRGKYVAVHDGRVVGEGDELIPVALEAYRQFGYVPIYVGPVVDPPIQTERAPRYRLACQEVGP